jgi:hypothetical protein
MAEDKNTEQTKKKGKRGKSKIQKKLDVLKKILKDGTKEHVDAIDKVIQQWEDYNNLSKLEKDFDELKARIEVAKSIKEQEAERKKAEEAEHKRIEFERKRKAEDAILQQKLAEKESLLKRGGALSRNERIELAINSRNERVLTAKGMPTAEKNPHVSTRQNPGRIVCGGRSFAATATSLHCEGSRPGIEKQQNAAKESRPTAATRM